MLDYLLLKKNGTEEANFINMNFRFPKGVTVDGLQSDIEQTVGQEGATVTRGARVMEPHYVPMDDPLVATLLQVYEDHTGEKRLRTNHRWRNLRTFVETWRCLWSDVPRIY